MKMSVAGGVRYMQLLNLTQCYQRHVLIRSMKTTRACPLKQSSKKGRKEKHSQKGVISPNHQQPLNIFHGGPAPANHMEEHKVNFIKTQ